MRKIELLAPAKNYQTGIAAINCGADAVYIGCEKFSARSRRGPPPGGPETPAAPLPRTRCRESPRDPCAAPGSGLPRAPSGRDRCSRRPPGCARSTGGWGPDQSPCRCGRSPGTGRRSDVRTWRSPDGRGAQLPVGAPPVEVQRSPRSAKETEPSAETMK